VITAPIVMETCTITVTSQSTTHNTASPEQRLSTLLQSVQELHHSLQYLSRKVHNMLGVYDALVAAVSDQFVLLDEEIQFLEREREKKDINT
jgi:hypothetical protein